MEIYNGTYCVYVHTNKINGKKYVGQTINGQNPNKRWRDGNGYRLQCYFYRAIQKYGWDNFGHEVIASNLTKQEADNFEKLLIKKLNTTNNSFGYNITAGGEGVFGLHQSEESINKYKQSMRIHLDNPDYLLKMRAVAPKTSVMQFSEHGEFIKEYESTKEAERQTGVRSGGISHCALNDIPSAGGFVWIFPEDIDDIDSRIDNYQKKKVRNEPIVQLTLGNDLVKIWDYYRDAANELNISHKNINAVCRGRRKTTGGYRWMYLSDYLDKCNAIDNEVIT